MNKQRIEKPWGYEEILEINENYMVKYLFMKAGHSCSLQYHKEKHETIVVFTGELEILHGNKTTILKAGDYLSIKPTVVHRMSSKEDCLYLEASTSQLDDVIRVEDNYGRV